MKALRHHLGRRKAEKLIDEALCRARELQGVGSNSTARQEVSASISNTVLDGYLQHQQMATDLCLLAYVTTFLSHLKQRQVRKLYPNVAAVDHSCLAAHLADEAGHWLQASFFYMTGAAVAINGSHLALLEKDVNATTFALADAWVMHDMFYQATVAYVTEVRQCLLYWLIVLLVCALVLRKVRHIKERHVRK